MMLNSAVILLILFTFNCINGKVHVANVLLPSSPTGLNAPMLMQKVSDVELRRDIPNAFKCSSFSDGDGGFDGGYLYVGHACSSAECIQMVRQRDSTANGVTMERIILSGQCGRCYGEFGQTSLHANRSRTYSQHNWGNCVFRAPWPASIEIRVQYTSEAIHSASSYQHTYARTSAFQNTYRSVSASVSAEASGHGVSVAFSGSLSLVNLDVQSNENEQSSHTGSMIQYKTASHQLWRTETITVVINNQHLIDVRKTYVQSPSQDFDYNKRLNLAKNYLRDYYQTDGSSPVIRLTFSVPAPHPYT